MWQYAVNAVLHELRGGRQGAVAWRDGAERAALRRQYVAAYRAFLERKHLEGAPASLAVRGPGRPAMASRASQLWVVWCRGQALEV